jgi:tRNA nucleotidyltransferase (CCA-adding enzyme)
MNINPHKIDDGAWGICKILQTSGFQAYIVGGCVRDLLLDVEPKDWDICSNATPEQVMEVFPKTYPTGLQHGTITVAMNDKHYEVTTFRSDGTYSDGRRPDNVEFVLNLEEDLLRRDFTINAMAYDPISEKLNDPFHGLKDLQNKTIRAVGHAAARFSEDGLRVMRAARFASRLNYTIEHTTLTGMAVCSHKLDSISKERIKDELVKILQTQKPSIGLQLLHDIEAFEFVIPHFQKRPQELKIDLEAINECDGKYETKLAILLYDQGTDEFIDKILRLMTFSNEEINNTLFMLKTLEVVTKIYEEWGSAPQLPPIAIRRCLAFIKNTAPYGHIEALSEFIKFVKALKLDGVLSDLMRGRDMLVWGKNELKISGKDLIEMGLQPGPLFKKMLEEAYTEIILNPDNNNKEHLIRFITSWLNPTNVIES